MIYRRLNTSEHHGSIQYLRFSHEAIPVHMDRPQTRYSTALVETPFTTRAEGKNGRFCFTAISHQNTPTYHIDFIPVIPKNGQE